MSFWTTTTGAVLVIGAFALTSALARALPDLLATPNEPVVHAGLVAAPASQPGMGAGPGVTSNALRYPVMLHLADARHEHERLFDPTRSRMQHALAESTVMTAHPIVP